MIPPTPLLLATTAHALSRYARRLPRRNVLMQCSLEFVYEVGYISHFDVRVGRSTWPVPPTPTVPQLLEHARGQRWMRPHVQEGDLILFRDHASPGELTAAIVLHVTVRGWEHDPALRRCRLLWARDLGDGTMQIVHDLRWCNTGERDVAIRWCAAPDELESAA